MQPLLLTTNTTVKTKLINCNAVVKKTTYLNTYLYKLAIRLAASANKMRYALAKTILKLVFSLQLFYNVEQLPPY